MAKRTLTVLTDDLTGEELPAGTGQTVGFGLDGTSYEVDLSKENADELREVFKRYTQAARRVPGRQTSVKPQDRPNGHHPKVVRAWAKENGHDVPDRGRIPQTVIDAYEARNK